MPGATAAARDAAFGDELAALGLKVVTGSIHSVQDAEQAEQELWRLNRHAVRIPVPFNHWTEDGFHNPDGYVPDCSTDIDTCADHGTLSDWVPVAPHVPAADDGSLAAMDAYLADPTDTRLQAMVHALPRQDSMPGTYPVGEVRYLDGSKYPSIYFATHCMRLEVMGKPGCYDKGVAPYPYQDGMWERRHLGQPLGHRLRGLQPCNSTWQTCAQPPANLPAWPTHLLNNLTPGSHLSDHFQRLRHPWMTLWWVHFDPTLLVTGDPTAEQDEYFTRSLFWANNNDWDNHGQGVHPTYSLFNAYQVLMHNVAVLNTPELASCDKIPATHPDLGAFPCTAVDMRSGYYPELTNLAEGKDFINNNSDYQTLYQPQDGRKGTYQRLVGNMYRLFFWKLIGDLQKDAWMCRPDIEALRITRAKTFLTQPEIHASEGDANRQMFDTLETLLASARKSCPPKP